MALIVMGGLKDNELSDIRAAAAELSPVWAARLSVFWSDPNFVVGRFPPLDRIDYLDHAVTLVERQRSTPPRPTLDEIRTRQWAMLTEGPLNHSKIVMGYALGIYDQR
jgi:hypothetical protein